MSEREHSAGIGDVERVMRQRSGRPVEPGSHRTRRRWTPLTAIAALIASVLFTWAFLHVILSNLFAAGQIRH
jgi:hypothetical protein